MPAPVQELRANLNKRATSLLIKAQMLLSQQRWVQPMLAVTSASALISNALWSHTDEAALHAMRSILREDGLEYPKLRLTASAGPKATSGEGDECVTGQQVLLEAKITREHAKSSAGDAPQPNNPQGIYEAYCARSIALHVACVPFALPAQPSCGRADSLRSRSTPVAPRKMLWLVALWHELLSSRALDTGVCSP